MSEHVADLAESSVHGLLDATTADRVAYHCGTCPVCREAVDQARGRLEQLKAVPGETASPQLIQVTLKKVGGDIRRQRMKRRIGSAPLGTPAAPAWFIICLPAYV